MNFAVALCLAVFALETDHVSLIFNCSDKGVWRLPYVGLRLSAPDDVLSLEGRTGRWHGDTVHPSYGVYGAPLANMDVDKFGGLAVRHADGSLVSDLAAVGSAPKEVPDDPGIRHVVLCMKDRRMPFFVDQHFRADGASDVIETWLEIRHEEPAPVELLRMDSFAWSMPRVARDYTLHTLSSWWGCEGQLESAPLVKSQALTINSRNGVRGAWDANPAFMLALDGATEDAGGVFAGVLAWSGAWRMNFRRDWGDVVEIRAGADNGNGAYRLEPGRTLTTPVFAFTYTEKGRGQVSRNFHRWARTRWLPHRTQMREVLLNSWEGSYLAFTEKTLTDMMDGVAEMGGEMFVVDDGWFGEGEIARDHNAGDLTREGVCDSALGDWAVNRRKLPRGIKYLTSEAAKRGLKFGIWVEPEMVNVGKSALHARLPESPLQVKGRPILMGRGGTQTVLDFTNPKVVDDLYAQLDALYSIPGVSYIKWDANANIFNPGSVHLPPESQGNVWFDYTRGVYNLLARLQKAHPETVTQACSSGGGHMDYGTLRYCDEFWVSDDTDARERVFMQWGASQFYPASAQACHVTVCPNHQTKRTTPLKFRFDVAMSGRLGFELHPKNMTSEEVSFAKQCVADYKRLRPVIQGGDLYRLVSPYDSSYASLMYVSDDKAKAVVFVWGLNRGPNREFPKMIRLKGLDPAKRYRLSEINRLPDGKAHVKGDGRTVTGEALMNFGIEPYLSAGDYDSCVLTLDARNLEPVRAESPRLRIGVLADTHINETRASCEDVAHAYRFFKSARVDAIVNCGDIAHRYNPKGYAHYRDIRRETYPDPQAAPRELFVMAGHDTLGFPDGREAVPWTNTYAHVKAALGVDHEMYADTIVKGCHCLVFPQCLDFARAERMLAAACVDTPGKPVFVFDHIPAFGTTEGSVSDGCPNRRQLYAKFPQAVVVTGHAHTCLRNPVNLWQGEFVTVSGGGFANWEGETTGVWRGGSRLRHFLVIEVFDGRLVFRRYDLDGGPEEIGAGHPWTVDWPRTGVPAAMPADPTPAFPAGATLALTNAPGAQGDVELQFPAAVTPETLACYRIGVARISKDGSVRPLAEQDLPAEFVLPKAKRRRVFTDILNGGLFTPGETYRVSVTPVGFGGELGKELSATWIGKPATRMPLVWIGVPEEARHGAPIELRQGREVRLKLPADIWERVPAGARVRVVADIDFEQADDSIVTFSLYGDKTGGRYPWQVVSPLGNSSLRYAFDATLPKVKQTYSLAFRKGGGARIVIRSVRIETRDPLPVPVGKAGAPRLFFAGDSTLDDHGRSLSGMMQYPNQSWGTTLQAAMVDGCVVRNYARSGASTKSFEASGVWKQLIDDVRPGDFVAIEFGHNDQKRGTEFYLKNRWSDPKGLFCEIVRRWVGEVRAKGATPILLSPICRGTFDAAGKKLVDTTHASDGVCLGSYRDAMRELSEELGCSFVDMNTLTKDLMERLGKEASMQFFVISTGIVKGRDGEPSKDITHPVRAGAEAFAKLFLDDVKARRLPVAALFR